MSDATLVEIVLGRLVLPVALLLNPFLLARCTAPTVDRARFPLVVSVWALILQPLLALLLHVSGVPIAPIPLGICHGVITAIAIALLRVTGRTLLPTAGDWPGVQLWIFGVLAILVFPFTHLAGIDTYQWSDFATIVAADQRITWLMHPLSLFGYTARSRASLHPLLMGSIRALGVTNIESAFYLASLVMCAVGVTSAGYLARKLALRKQDAALYTMLYVLSPVYIRYVHWSTGRGAFLAVLPLFVAALLDLPRLSAWGVALLSGILLLLSHKTGLIAVVVLPLILVSRGLFPRRHPRICAGLLGCAFVASLAFAPARYFAGPFGVLAGWLRYDLARFAWIAPALMVAALGMPRRLFQPSDSRFMWLSLLVIFPAAHHMEMYPALIALPFITYAGLKAFRALQAKMPGNNEMHLRGILALTLCGALAIVLQRSIESMPHRVYLAARHLEKIDPHGPFEIVSPWRSRIQGMVTGCPRFTVEAGDDSEVALKPPPSRMQNPRQIVEHWIGYLRFMFETGARAAFYGNPHARYYVIPDTASPPENGTLLYDQKQVRIYRVPLPAVP